MNLPIPELDKGEYVDGRLTGDLLQIDMYARICELAQLCAFGVRDTYSRGDAMFVVGVLSAPKVDLADAGGTLCKTVRIADGLYNNE